MVAIYGALAVLIGLPLGAVVPSWFASYAAGILLDFGPGDSTPPAYALALAVGRRARRAAAGGVGCPMRAGHPRQRRDALELHRHQRRDFGHGLVDRLLGLVRGLPRPVALALRNTFLRKGRLAMTLATLVLASAVVMAVGSVQASIGRPSPTSRRGGTTTSRCTFARPVSSQVALREASKVEGVVGVQAGSPRPRPWSAADGTENTGLTVVGLPPATNYIVPRLVSGRWLRTGETRRDRREHRRRARRAVLAGRRQRRAQHHGRGPHVP